MTLKFITWDVEHGSAAYIRTPNGKHIAVDLGAQRETQASDHWHTSTGIGE